MDEAQRSAFLDRFAPGGAGVGFAVLGGSFGEGVDLRGDRLVGAFVATLGLPQVNPRNEQLKACLDAVFGADFLLPLEAKGLAKVFYKSSAAGAGGDGFGAFLVTDAFRKAHPEATQKVVNGFVRAAAWVSDEKNHDEVFQIWSRAGTPVAIITKANEGTALKGKYNPRLDTFFKARYESGLAFNKEQKLTRRDVDLAAWTDASYVEKAIADQELDGFWVDRDAAGADAK